MYNLKCSNMSFNYVYFSAPPYLQDLHSQMKFLMANSKAKNTTKTQNSYLKSWFRYCQLAKIPGCPVGGWHLAMYATSLVMGGRIKSADSIANYVSAVHTYHTDMGFNCPTPSQFGPLKRVIDGFRRLARRPVKRSLPVTPTILVNFLITQLPPPFCPIAFHNLITFKILSLFYFLTMLRASSFLPTAYNDVDTRRLVCWGDVHNIHFQGVQGILISLELTKTIQNGERVQQVPLAANHDIPQLCPVRAIAALRNIVGEHNITDRTPLFQTRDYDGNLRPILRKKFDDWYRLRLREMDLDASKFTLHGFRAGGIQQVLMSEQNLALAKITSDHTSDVILNYSFVPADRRLTISQKINRNLNNVINKDISYEPLPANVLRDV